MSIIAYDGIFSLLVFLVFLVPAVVAGLKGYSLRRYGMLISLPLLYMLCRLRLEQFAYFFLGEMLFLYGYYSLRKRFSGSFVYYLFFVLSILPIVYVKAEPYTGFNSIGFLGISYMSFRIWQLMIEIHDNHIERFDVLDMLYFISFFPTLQSGPIDRYQRFVDDISVKKSPIEYRDSFLEPGLKKTMHRLYL